MGNESSKRLAFLDFVRGIAALVVFLQHLAERLWEPFYQFTHEWFNFGKFGLVIFFLVSGFVIPLSLEKGTSIKKFWIGRLFRLYPLYWFSLIASLFLFGMGFKQVLTIDFSQNIALHSLVNVTMLQEFLGFPHAIPLYYTLTLEMAFYIACTLLFLLGWHRKSYGIAWIALSVNVLLGLLAPVILERRVPFAGLFYILCLFIGTVLYRFHMGSIARKSVLQLLGTTAAVTSVGIYINYVMYFKENPSNRFSFAAVALSWTIAFAFFIAVYLWRETKFPKIFIWLGSISYSLYLLHPLVLKTFSDLLPPMPSFIVTIPATLLIAAVTYNFIEIPCLNLGYKVRKRLSFNTESHLKSGA